MKHYVYMLLLENGMVYVGSTSDLQRRLQEHLGGSGSKATAEAKPVELIHSEPFPDSHSAILRERQIKGWTRAKKLALARGNIDQLHRLATQRA